MIKESVERAINEQIKNEFESAYLYLAMSARATEMGLPGMAHWLRAQYEEERGHALRLLDFLADRGGTVNLQALGQPATDFDSPLDLFKTVLAHEQKITGLVNKLYELALQENDYPTQIEMQWFINEQVEEERTAAGIVEQLKMAGKDSVALFLVDKELGSRE
ncbi:MAG: ferritin [Calditrichaeota bacterium]|nr:MAG: ferritin [Calditrichota bacterium]